MANQASTSTDWLSKLPMEMTELLASFLREDAKALSSLACLNREVRGKVESMEGFWQGLCQRYLLEPCPGESHRQAFVKFLNVRHSITEEKSSKRIFRCYRDVVLQRGPGMMFELGEGEDFSSAAAANWARQYYSDCKEDYVASFRNRGVGDPEVGPDAAGWFGKTNTGHAYNDDYFVASRSTRGEEGTVFTAWSLKGDHFGQVLMEKEILPYEIPPQNIALWRHHLVLVPFCQSNALLETRNIRRGFEKSGSLFKNPEDKERDPALQPLYDREDREDLIVEEVAGERRVFVHGDRILFVDNPYSSWAGNSSIFLVEASEREDKDVELDLLFESQLPRMNTAMDSGNFAVDQRGPLFVMGCFVFVDVLDSNRGLNQSYIVCFNMETAAMRILYPEKLAPLEGIQLVRSEYPENNGWYSAVCTGATYDFAPIDEEQTEKLEAFRSPNVPECKENSTPPEVVLLTGIAYVEGVRMIKINGDQASICPISGARAEYRSAMGGRSHDCRNLAVAPGSRVAAALLHSDGDVPSHFVVGVSLESMRQLWRLDLSPTLHQDLPSRSERPLLIAGHELFFLAGASDVKVVLPFNGETRRKYRMPEYRLTRPGRALPPLDPSEYERRAEERKVPKRPWGYSDRFASPDERKLSPEEALNWNGPPLEIEPEVPEDNLWEDAARRMRPLLWDAAVLASGRVLLMHNRQYFSPLVFDMIESNQ